MKSTGTASWVLGGIAIIMVALVMGFLLVFQPNLNAKADAEDQSRLLEDEITQLEANIARMRVLQQDEPQMLNQIASVSLDLPPQPQLSNFHRMIDAAFIEFEIPMVRVEYGPLTPVAPVFATEPADEPAGEGDVGEPTEDPAAPPVPLEGELVNLYSVSVSINVEGPLQNVLSLMARLQSQTDRFFTIDSFDITRATPTEERDKRPALSESDVEGQLRGSIFVLWSEDTSFIPDEVEDLPPYVPGEDLDDWFAPLEGAELTEPR